MFVSDQISDILSKVSPEEKVHHHDICINCSSLTRNEEERQKALKYRFQHSWLSDKKSFCEKTDVWWAVYVEGRGLYCLLCSKHDTSNVQNKKKIFNEEPSTRFRPEALSDHVVTQQHKDAVSTELCQRVSCFQKQLDDRARVKDDVLIKVFTTIYWLMKEEIANKKVLSMLKLLEQIGLDDIKHFNHKSAGSLREIFLTIGEAVEDDNLASLKRASHYGLMVDEATDISVLEQMITFVQFYDRVEEKVKVSFLSIDNLLENFESANSEAISSMIVSTLKDFELSPESMSSFVSDGASVMVGKNNGVAARLKRTVNSRLVSIHCICHRLALACTDTLGDISYIKQVQLWLLQLWKLFENSPKKLAVYLKTQMQLKSVTLSNEKSREKAAKRLKKACQTRWLSFNESVQAIILDYPAVLQSLTQLKDEDAAASGLLTKMNSFKFLSVVYILAEVLPHLAILSKSFQKGVIDFSQISPCIESTKDKLDDLIDNSTPQKRLISDLHDGGRLQLLGVTNINDSPSNLAEMSNTLTKYVESLKINIDRRFEECLPILTAAKVFDPLQLPARSHPAFKMYGQRQISTLAEHFAPDDAKQSVTEELLAEWGKLKYDMLNQKVDILESQNSDSAVDTEPIPPTTWCLLRLMQLESFYPQLSKIADILLSMPVSNAWPERGASALKRLKTRLRSSIRNDMLQALMHVSVNGAATSSPKAKSVIRSAVAKWLKRKPRRKLPRKTPQKTSEKLMMDACIQTDPCNLTRGEFAELVRDEVRLYAKAVQLPLESPTPSDDDWSESECEV